MRILGVDLLRSDAGVGHAEHTIVLLDGEGRVARVERTASMIEVATTVGRLVGDEPFVLGVGAPIVVPQGTARTRPVDNRLRRRLGFRLPAGGRGALSAQPEGVPGDVLLAGLAAAGHPCLPYPDRAGRRAGLAETHPGLALKLLLWQASPLAAGHDPLAREELLRAYQPPPYRSGQLGARAGWAERVAGVDLTLAALGDIEDYDLVPVREALERATDVPESDRAAALLDAVLIAGTVRRYLTAPETCVFAGDHDGGYMVLPADALVRRVALSGSADARDRLFPQTSLRDRLGTHARLRPVELLSVPGRPQRTQADFNTEPRYEFDNLDEMLWWKHCRHLSGPILPTEGLRELEVRLCDEEGAGGALRLMRSRHRTLSFRFDPPPTWRLRIPTRDGRTYGFRVIRAIYDTLPVGG